jgi:transglutaminase-like putative cysteine protease
MLLRISHLTRYYYSHQVLLAPHRLYLRPRSSPRQQVRSFRLQFAPTARAVATLDLHDNPLDWAYWLEPTTAMNIETEFEVETLGSNPFDFILRTDAVAFPPAYDGTEQAGLAPWLVRPPAAAESRLRSWLDRQLPSPPTDTLGWLTAVNSAVMRSIGYTRRDEHGIQAPGETLDLGTGSCRDFAALLVDLCRMSGLAARFVSGYLYDPPPDDPAKVVPTAMHAWVEVYLPGGGWRALDPTRGIFCDDAFVPVAHAVRGESVSPVQGSFSAKGAVTAELQADISVVRLD